MSKTVQVTYLPSERRSRVPVGTTLFTAAHWIGLAIDSTCGGQATCGKCRVQIRRGGVEVSPADRRHLSEAQLEQGWRLACRAEASRDTVCVVPEILELPKTATTGVGREVPLEPEVRKAHLRLPKPSENEGASDLDRLQRALAEQGWVPEIDLEALRRLPADLREPDFEITAVLSGRHLVAIEPGDTTDRIWGVAFDVGTTTVVGVLIDLTTGEVCAVESALNRQAVFGGDVISRIAYTMQGSKRCDEMQAAVVGTLNLILKRLFETARVAREDVYQAVTVGNSTMLHLMLGVEARSIALAPFVPAFSGPMSFPAAELGVEIHPRGRVDTFPVIGAYVGADTVAGLHATGIASRPEVRLFIDIGTNSEIALGGRDRLLATSAPAGPAFEGSCIRSGMVATTGAIERVVMGEEVEVAVVGGGPAQGICGSGLIDAVAQLRRAGLLDRSGRLSRVEEVPGHPLVRHLVESEDSRGFALTDRVQLSQRDIRELQSAKSSVATGVQVLMERLEVGVEDLEEVLLAGSFGSSIDPLSARDLGLVPPVSASRIRFVGNAAAEGAKMALLSFRERQVAYDLAHRIEYIELSARPDFNDLFVAGLGFPEWRGEE